MQAERAPFPRATFLLAGFAAGAVARAWHNSGQAREIASLRHSLADLEARLADRQAEWDRAIAQVGIRLDEHETRLSDVPSTSQIIAAMDELLSKTMRSLNQRLSAQADAIELLKTTVGQTDGLLERVLESLDALREVSDDRASSPAGG